MKTVKVLLMSAISLAMVFCFCGTAFATEPIDLAAQKTEYVTAKGQAITSADIEVQGYIVPAEYTAVEDPKPSASKRMPKTGDSDFSQRSLTLALIFVMMAAALFSAYLRFKDRGAIRTSGTSIEKT